MESSNVSARASNRRLTAVHLTATGVTNNKEFLEVTHRTFNLMVALDKKVFIINPRKEPEGLNTTRKPQGGARGENANINTSQILSRFKQLRIRSTRSKSKVWNYMFSKFDPD